MMVVPIIAHALDTHSSLQVEPFAKKEMAIWPILKKTWDEDIQFHGFASQGLFHTSGNNIYGKSKNTVSAGLTELGLNISYRAFGNLSFAAQGLYRRAGRVTGNAGKLTLDYGFVDVAFPHSEAVYWGIRAGRIKNPWGLYNETRDVASTHPTISLPLIYFERSRALLLALDGGQVYADYYAPMGNFSFKFNYGLLNADDDEFLSVLTLEPKSSGHLAGKPSVVTKLRYESLEGRYVFALSYGKGHIGYHAVDDFDPYSQLKGYFDTFIVSAQYNGENFSLESEYNRQWTHFSGIPANKGAKAITSEIWYVQAGYRLLDNVQVTVRYDKSFIDKNDKLGKKIHSRSGLPAHFMFTQDIVVGARWDITPSWMVRAEYQRVHGASLVSVLDNPNMFKLVRNWNIYGLQVAFRF